ncbi:MAG TPA: MarR family transcriptional regulator [Ignavibacteria bacterium]|nr:MarR family transcriptional regulator [Ignavibacteria bacterium]HAX47865.1 MarR family transcriptional regulator [Bacteroidota bacterium]HRE10572.1 MarR family transcriptional regulator [Ignavibacteria bacterium]HRF64859.1 MarR family transcriptional regulator [Ignavibacteria bacterium]HRJ04761.1 MarR family transcriptional regulator [Ignavibacteria bacterium]
MGESLKKWLKLSKNLDPREEVDLNLRVAVSLLDAGFNRLMDSYNITGAQYNVLRILKGVYPEGHARCEIATRMVERASDITRIIDRLEKQGLVQRDRTSEDRRMSITKITKKGIELLEKISPHLTKEHLESTKDLSVEECLQLSALLEKLYTNKM